jgi:hypothetical protein
MSWRPLATSHTRAVLSCEAVTAQRPAASVAIRMMLAVCMPVSSRGRGRVVGSAAMPGGIGSESGVDRSVHDCKTASKMAPLKK